MDPDTIYLTNNNLGRVAKMLVYIQQRSKNINQNFSFIGSNVENRFIFKSKAFLGSLISKTKRYCSPIKMYCI